MKKELLRGLTMLTFVVAVAFATAVVANAQSLNSVTSDIPFDFVVGDRTLPAGEYRLSDTLTNGLTVRSNDARYSAMRLTNVIEPRRNKTHARLIFRRYGQRYFLAEVWKGGEEIGRQLFKSRQERAIERELSSIASKSEQGESAYAIVEVAAVVR